MSIQTYTELTDAVSNWLNHEDPATKDRIPTFIALAEIRTSRALRTLKLQTHAQYTVTAEDDQLGGVPLPTDFNGMVTVYLDYLKLERLSTDQWIRSGLIQPGGTQLGYVIIGDRLTVAQPIGEGSIIDWIYYAKQPPLGPVNQSTLLSLNYADMLLYSALADAQPYLKDEKRMPNFTQLYNAALDAARLEDEAMREDAGGPVLVTSDYTAASNDYRTQW